jgi:predicted metal-dependent hydrolase
LLARLRRDGAHIAARFGLTIRVIEPEPRRVKRRYGVCYSDGTIRIRLTHVESGKPLEYASLVNTLCHELAHLRHFNHGASFRRFYQEVLAYARAARIYEPAPLCGRGHRPKLAAARRRAARTPEAPRGRFPVQLSLFETRG